MYFTAGNVVLISDKDSNCFLKKVNDLKFDGERLFDAVNTYIKMYLADLTLVVLKPPTKPVTLISCQFSSYTVKHIVTMIWTLYDIDHDMHENFCIVAYHLSLNYKTIIHH